MENSEEKLWNDLESMEEKSKLKCEMKTKIWKKIVIRYEQYRRKASWKSEKIWKIQKIILKWYGKYGRKVSSNVKWYGKYGRKLWNDMENIEERQVE